MERRLVALLLVIILVSPLVGSIAATNFDDDLKPLDSTGIQLINEDQTTEPPILRSH